MRDLDAGKGLDQSEMVNSDVSVLPAENETFGFEGGMEKVISQVEAAVNENQSGPQVLCVNGYAGAGKSYFSTSLVDGFAKKGLKAVFIETDMYHAEKGVERYTHEDFFQQKRSWEAGESFTYFNTVKGAEERVDKVDVVIIGGIGARPEEIGVDPVANVFVKSPFLSRLSRKFVRDCIENSENPEQSLDVIMKELCDPSEGQDLLAHLLEQEKELGKVSDQADVCVVNDFEGLNAKIRVKGDQLVFEAEIKGRKYFRSQKLSHERCMKLVEILDVNSPEVSDQVMKSYEKKEGQSDAGEIEVLKKKLGV